jgi:peptidoglycan/LPS O-acetylase OafA/YrhL
VPSWFWNYNNAITTEFLFYGEFWVSVFFVLSGFVLTISFFKRRDPSNLVKGMFKRYARLIIPV